jgi:hypothetical protein
MRRIALVLALLAFPATAAAKEGAMFSPTLGTLTPGKATRVTLSMERGNDGVRPLVELEPFDGGRSLRFRASPLYRHVAMVTVTLPARPAVQRWFASVKVGGRKVRAGLEGTFVAGGAHTMTGVTTVFHPPVAKAEAGGAPAWPFVLAAALGSAGIGLWWRRRRA